MEQGAEAVLACHLLQQSHEQHIVVYRQVGFLEYRSKLKLVWSHLVMARLAGYAQLKGLHLKVFHKRLNALGDDAEVVVVHLLVLCRVVAHERSPGKHQVGTSRVESFVNEEVLLFPSQIRDNLAHFGVEELCHSRCTLRTSGSKSFATAVAASSTA